MNWLRRLFGLPRHIPYRPAHARVLTTCPLPRMPVAMAEIEAPATGEMPAVLVRVRFDHLGVN